MDRERRKNRVTNPGSSIADYQERLLVGGDLLRGAGEGGALEHRVIRQGATTPSSLVFAGEKGLALSRARVLDARLAEETAARSRPLFGVPLTVKDNIFLGGFPTTDASEAFRGLRPRRPTRSSLEKMLGEDASRLGRPTSTSSRSG